MKRDKLTKKNSFWVNKNAAIVILIIIVIPIVLQVRYDYNENQTQKFLANEISLLKTPSTCTLDRNSYTKGSLDIGPQWNLHYNCKTSTVSAYNEVSSMLRNLGFQTAAENTNSYDITVSNDKVLLSYRLEPSANKSQDSDINLETLTKSQQTQYWNDSYAKGNISGIGLSVCRTRNSNGGQCE